MCDPAFSEESDADRGGHDINNRVNTALRGAAVSEAKDGYRGRHCDRGIAAQLYIGED
jgi:hypothetical protein